MAKNQDIKTALEQDNKLKGQTNMEKDEVIARLKKNANKAYKMLYVTDLFEDIKKIYASTLDIQKKETNQLMFAEREARLTALRDIMHLCENRFSDANLLAKSMMLDIKSNNINTTDCASDVLLKDLAYVNSCINNTILILTYDNDNAQRVITPKDGIIDDELGLCVVDSISAIKDDSGKPMLQIMIRKKACNQEQILLNALANSDD